MDKNENKAYFREFITSSQCELMFNLNANIESVGLLHKDIRAVRQSDDTVGSLLQHLKMKLNRTIKSLENSTRDSSESLSSSENDENVEKQIEIPMELINKNKNKPVPAHTVLKNLLKMNNLSFEILGQHFCVLINSPLVKDIELPEILYCSFSIQPIKFYTLYTDSRSSKFYWYKSKDKQNWTYITNSYKYTINEDDVDHYLKIVCVPFNEKVAGPPLECISKNKVEKMGELPECPFQERHKFTTQELGGNSLRIVSYNILSCRYAQTNEQFPYCTPKALAIDYRKQLIAQELLGYKADIICLQEVDNVPFISFYKDIFKEAGYMSFYHRKGNKIPEGLCCIFDKKRFKKIDDHQVVYSEEIKKNKLFLYLWNSIKSNTDVRDCFLKQLTSLQVTVLKLKGTSNYIILGNTHLFYHPDAEHIRLLQANIATTYLDNLRRQYSSNGTCNVTVILLGDFNCVPTSSVVNYMINGRVDDNAGVWSKIKKSNLFHNFMFESACGLPKYTNYTVNFKDCLDYIFVERNKIKVTNIVPFPSEEELLIYDGLPNDVFPSDHLALITDLQFI